MGFFNFLQQQDATNIDPKTGKPLRLTKRPLSEAGQIAAPSFQPAGPSSMGGGDENPVIEDRAPEEADEPKLEIPSGGSAPTSPVAERNKLLTEIATLREKVADEIGKAQLAQSGARSNDYSLLKESALKAAPQADLPGIARKFEKYASDRRIDVSKLPSFERLEQATGMLKKMQFSEPIREAQTEAVRGLAGADLPNIQTKLDNVNKELERLQEERAFAPTVRREAEIKKQEANLKAYAESLTRQKVSAERTVGTIKPQDGQIGSSAAPATGTDIDSAFHGAGIDRKNIAVSVNDAVRGMSELWKTGFNPLAPVNFMSGLMSALPVIWPDGGNEAFQAWIKAESEAQQQQPQPGQGQGKAEFTQNVQSEADVRLEENRLAMRQARQDLANTQEMQTWPAIIAYILLAMLLGPRNAFMFFSNARQRGTLQGWLRDLEIERKEILEEERYEREQKDQARREAARSLERKSADERELSNRKELERYKHFLDLQARRIEVSEGLSSRQKDAFDKEYSYYTSLAGRFGNAAKNAFGTPKETELAKKEQFYLQKAESLLSAYLQLKQNREQGQPSVRK